MLCPYCGEDAVIKDKIGAHEQSICSECGLVVSDQTFEDSTDCYFNAPSLGALPTGASSSLLAAKRDADKKSDFVSPIGVEEITCICSAMGGISSSWKEEGMMIYEDACKHPDMEVRNRSKQFKEALGACCMYIVLRRHEYPITAREMTSSRRLPINDFILMLRRMKQIMKIELPRWSMGQLTAHTLQKANFDRGVIERTQKLMQICDKCWLVSGRSPEAIIVIAAYFAWLSYQKSDVGCVSLSSFCKANNLRLPKSNGILKRMKDILLAMAERIPWIKSIKPTQLLYYIEDIVKYKASLMRKAFAVEENGESADLGHDRTELCLKPPLSRKRKVEDSDPGVKSNDEIDAEISAKYGHVINSTEIDPNEFADEMDMYIKTVKEKEDVKLIRQIGGTGS
ncbi:transcription factor IIIB 50 kDa subunit-like [Haliotis rubra]|uniref:transcription factor IIIB 50 kDa subunit-like n=1 Tax=Haliotis rubra TaxID=36100 RepID=UPI001EE5B14A|nr:transcription factor IIIB 50 kDa subunit-like [Haliotis rubra]